MVFLGFDYRIKDIFLAGVWVSDFLSSGIETSRKKNAEGLVLTI